MKDGSNRFKVPGSTFKVTTLYLKPQPLNLELFLKGTNES
jgi:hypothetical protein